MAQLRIRCDPLEALHIDLEPKRWERHVPVYNDPFDKHVLNVSGDDRSSKLRFGNGLRVANRDWSVSLIDAPAPGLEFWNDHRVPIDDNAAKSVQVVGVVTTDQADHSVALNGQNVVVPVARVWDARHTIDAILAAEAMSLNWHIILRLAALGTDDQLRLVGHDDVQGEVSAMVPGRVRIPPINLTIVAARSLPDRERAAL
jgi:hypothetical protein